MYKYIIRFERKLLIRGFKMGSIDISKPKLVVTDMSKKHRMTPEEIGKAAAETVSREFANRPKPSKDAPLVDRVMWEMDHTKPTRDTDKILQDKLLKIINNSCECNAYA